MERAPTALRRAMAQNIHRRACRARSRANRTSPQEHTARGGLGRLVRLHVEGEFRLLGSKVSGSGTCVALRMLWDTGEPRESRRGHTFGRFEL
jgi:hypothetical protein